MNNNITKNKSKTIILSNNEHVLNLKSLLPNTILAPTINRRLLILKTTCTKGLTIEHSITQVHI